MANLKILILGASGYIGGSILTQLQASSDSNIKSAEISVLVRSQEQANVFQSHGVVPIIFKSLDDTGLLTQVASEHDVVINAAISFSTPAAESLIRGLSQRKKVAGKEVLYLHTSGTSSLADHPLTGAYIEPRVFSDTDQIHQYQLERESHQPYDQRTTDVAVVKAGLAADVKSYIIMPPTIYGPGSGLFNKLSVQEPLIIKMALTIGQTPVLGTGNQEMDHVHIQDLAEFYDLLLGKLLQGDDMPWAEHGIYFTGVGVHTWHELSEGVAKAGKALGALNTDDVRELSIGEFTKLCSSCSTIVPPNEQQIELSFASRARTEAKLAKKMGWRPKMGKKEWEQHFMGEFQAVLEKETRET